MKKIIFVFLAVANLTTVFAQPLNDIVKREILTEKKPLNY